MSDAQLKVLLLTGRFEFRGSSRQTLNLARRLPDHRIESMIACSDAGSIPRADWSDLQLREYSSLESAVFGRLGEWLISSDLRHDMPDLIHVQQRNMLTVGRRLAHRLQRPYVASIHDYLGPREKLCDSNGAGAGN